MANVVETDTSSRFEKRILFSEIGECLYFRGGYYDINNSTEEITGLVAAKARVFVFKKSSITEMIADDRGTINDPFNIIPNRRIDTGTTSSFSIRDLGDFMIFAGENGVSLFDGVTIMNIDEGIRNKFSRDISLDYYSSIFSQHIKETSHVIFSVPKLKYSSNVFYVFNIRTKGWVKWHFPWYFLCCERFRKTSYIRWSDIGAGYDLAGIFVGSSKIVTGINTDDLYVGMKVTGSCIAANTFIDVVGEGTITLSRNATTAGNFVINCQHTWQSIPGQWQDYRENSDVFSYLFGSEDGNIYEMSDIYTNDAGYSIDASLITKDYYINDPINTIKLLEILLVIKPHPSYTIGISVSMDYGITWSEETEVSLVGAGELIDKTIGMYERGKSVRIKINNIESSQFELDGIYLGFNESGELS